MCFYRNHSQGERKREINSEWSHLSQGKSTLDSSSGSSDVWWWGGVCVWRQSGVPPPHHHQCSLSPSPGWACCGAAGSTRSQSWSHQRWRSREESHQISHSSRLCSQLCQTLLWSCSPHSQLPCPSVRPHHASLSPSIRTPRYHFTKICSTNNKVHIKLQKVQ